MGEAPEPPGQAPLEPQSTQLNDGRVPADRATSAADSDGDGVVDLIETEPMSGTTMVPFDEKPAAMDVAHGSYPEAPADGSYTYLYIPSEHFPQETGKSFGEHFDGKLDLDHRVIHIHGVPESAELPTSLESLDLVPAHVTLPIACGEIKRAD